MLTRRSPIAVPALALALSVLKLPSTALQAVASLPITARGRLGRFLGNLIGLYVIARIVKDLITTVQYLRLEFTFQKDIKNRIGSVVAQIAEDLPVIGAKIKDEMAKVEAKMRHELKGSLNPADRNLNMPVEGLSHDHVLAKMKALADQEASRWQGGLVSGAVYHGGSELLDLQSHAMRLSMVCNPLHADLWPSVTKYEAEVVAMTASLVNGGNTSVCGTMTSGGTESIFMAAKAHREWALKTKGITEPQIVAPVTAHAAIDKACEILKIKLVHVPVDEVTRKVDVAALRQRLTSDTIMIYSSAPSFPHGIVDPIDELSMVAQEHGCGLHVDGCLGGYVLPFARALNRFSDPFDFELPGVTSMSLDVHKFGYTAKGTSVVLYRNSDLRAYQYFAYPQWPGALYITPSTAGSRPGALIAAAWATIMAVGRNGYLDATKQILDAATEIKQGIAAIDGMFVYGDPKAMVVGFGAKEFDIYRLGQLMTAKGWSLNMLQHPASAHVCVTLPIAKNVKRLLEDIRECAQQLKGHKADPQGSAPVYGLAAALPSGPLVKILTTYTNIVLEA